MKLTTVTISYGETQSLPKYSNVKPQLTLTAELDEWDIYDDVVKKLWEAARAEVHEQIDLALEANDRPAKYAQEPRYQVVKSHNDRFRSREAPLVPALVAIVPDDIALTGDPRLIHSGRVFSARNLRLNHAWSVAKAIAQADTLPIIDCSDGDLSKLEAALRMTELEPTQTEAEPLPASERHKAGQPDDATSPF